MARVVTEKDRAKNHEWHRNNRDRLKKVRREFYEKHPEKMYEKSRRAALKANYGITLEEYDGLFKKQRGRCAICRQKYGRTLHVDHDHRTSKVRGLLCARCNMGLGLFQDNARQLAKAIDYLRRV